MKKESEVNCVTEIIIQGDHGLYELYPPSIIQFLGMRINMHEKDVFQYPPLVCFLMTSEATIIALPTTSASWYQHGYGYESFSYRIRFAIPHTTPLRI